MHDQGFFVVDGGGTHCGDVTPDSFGALDDPAPGALYVIEEEGGVRVYVFLFQDDVCLFDLEGLDVLYDGLCRFLGGHEMGGDGCVFCAELIAPWLVFCALGPGELLRKGRGASRMVLT